jgi:four helix bundle protein
MAMDLVTEIYKITDAFPAREAYALTDQLRRASISIPTNIAEGAARQTKREFINFLHIAQGSLSELDTQLEIAKRLAYFPLERLAVVDAEMIRIDKMLTGLIHQQQQQHLKR